MNIQNTGTPTLQSAKACAQAAHRYLAVLAMRRRKAKHHIPDIENLMKTVQDRLICASSSNTNGVPNKTQNFGEIMRNCGVIADTAIQHVVRFTQRRPFNEPNVQYMQSLALTVAGILAFLRTPVAFPIDPAPLKERILETAKNFMAVNSHTDEQAAAMQEFHDVIAHTEFLSQKRDPLAKMASLFSQEIAEKLEKAFPPRPQC